METTHETGAAIQAPDRDLDVTGLNCPLPILKTRVVLRQMQPGQVIRVRATDPHAAIDFKAYCARTDHELLSLDEAGGIIEFRIRRGAASD
ncbi:MAG: sulfurtransferase TusA family protein [Gammaproteobacteria bacterium]